MSIAVVTARLGDFDRETVHVSQSMPYDNFVFTDENFPPRFNSMTPRLQAKIPKFFGWQLVPNYDYYLWIDGNGILTNTDSVKYFYDCCQGYDIVVFKHKARPNIRQETRYVRKGIRQSRYIHAKYTSEWFQEQYATIWNDKDYLDDFLVIAGIFMYKNTPQVQETLKEWWYNVTRYCIQDQLSFSYVIKKAGLKINILPPINKYSPYFELLAHNYREK